MLLRSWLPLLLLTVGSAPSEDDGRLRVLFLGDRGHHQPAARAQDALVPLRERGIDIFYEESLGVLAPERLADYDAVLLYANHASITPEQETALVSWVEGGGAFVPVHCASYCFLNSPRFVELVGAQFRSHETGVFTTQRVADHPAIADLPSLESWDETYVHHRHGTDRTVLATRDGEPWTWVRTQGEGRVFYTAWGHDERTWEQAAFHDLLERGIRWAVGDDALAAPRPDSPFTTIEAADRVPNYQPGKHGEMARTLPAPLSAEESLKRMTVPPDLRVELFASEPLIRKPIAMCWDARGRLFVAETVDYPNERKDEGGLDRISIVEDTDGDGRADKRTLFADGLSIPTSLVCANGGLIVTQAPHTLFLRDTDGDDVADERRVLFSGWGTGDTHAGPSNLRYGFDGNIWGTVGYSGFNDGSRRFGQGIFRFAPDGSRLEFLASTSNNTWGLGFSEEGYVFASTANGNPSVHMALTNKTYESMSGWSPGALQTIAESLEFHPVTSAVRQVDWHGKFTAAAGHALYTARAFPERYWNRAAFVNAPTGHLVHQFFLEPDGAHFVARDGWNLVASDDEWTSPIFSDVGPDGAVWLIDWYSYIVQHNPTPPGFENGRGNAYVTPLRDKTHGRIYRVVPEGRALPGPRDLTSATTAELVAALSNTNLFWRLTAQRLLLERGASDARAALLALLAEQELDAVGLAPGALHALWTLTGLDFLNEIAFPDGEDALVAALRHAAPSVRRAAVTLLPRERWTREVLLSARMLDDPDPQVRLAAFITLSEMERSDAAGAAVYFALERDGALADRWIRDAATAAAARHDAGFLKSVLANTRFDVGEREGPVNVLVNSELEGDGPQPRGWAPRTYSGQSELTLGTGRTGGCVRIQSEMGSDTSWFQAVDVEPDTTYRLSGWIKTVGFSKGSGLGALFNVHEIQGTVNARTKPVTAADSDWTRVEVVFDTGGRSRISINCLFGGWGQSSGTAYYDDVRLERLNEPLLGGELGRIVSRVAGHYAARGPVDSIDSVLGALTYVPSEVAGVFLESLATRWPDDAKPDPERLILALDGLTFVGPLEMYYGELTHKLGFVPSLESAAEVLEKLRTALADSERESRARVAAAEHLVRLDDGPFLARGLLEQVDIAADPAFVGGVLRALGASRAEETGSEILARWSSLSPTVQRDAIRVLLRRTDWTRALLIAIDDGKLPASLVEPDRWTRLTQHPESSIRLHAEELLGRSGSADGAALVEQFASALDLPGDAARGDLLFTDNCAKCHVLAGRGTRIGPDLDGIGARPKSELLIEILDPNRSVETNYQLWTVRTKAGQIHGGRLVAETRTTLELLDADGGTTVLDRADLDLVKPSALSLMPAGFESLGEQGLADLLAYLEDQHD